MGLHYTTRKALYDALLDHGPLAADRIASLGFDRRTTRRIIAELGPPGWLEVRDHGTWAAGPEAGHVMVFDVSWRKMTAALCDAHGAVLRRDSRTISLAPWQGASDSVKTIRSCVQALTEELVSRNPPLIVGATIIWPGPIPLDPIRPIGSGLRHRAWRHVDLRLLFSQEINKSFRTTLMPVFFCNDAHAEALGEAHYGVGRGARNLLLIKICEGIGSALIVDGHVYEGAHGKAGEIGHVVPNLTGIPEPSPAEARAQRRRPCTCGADNHLESYASGTAIVRELFTDSERLTYEACIQQIAARRDEFAVRSALQRSGTIIGRTLWPLIQMLDLDRVIINSEPADSVLLDNIIISLKGGAQIDGERITRGTVVSTDDPTMSLRGGALCAIKEYVVPRLQHGILGDPWGRASATIPVAVTAASRRPRAALSARP